MARAHAVTGLVEAGKVLLPERAPWLADFLDETAEFPVTGTGHDDQVDALVYALQALAGRGEFKIWA